MKLDTVIKIAKIGGFVLSAVGTLATGWAGKKENDKMLENLVNEKLKK